MPAEAGIQGQSAERAPRPPLSRGDDPGSAMRVSQALIYATRYQAGEDTEASHAGELPRYFFSEPSTIVCERDGQSGEEMTDTVMVEIPVTPEAAEALGDPARRERIGRLVSNMLSPQSPSDDPLAAIFASIKTSARANELTDEEIEAELAAYNGERRL
jgi:hypothetical protein